MVGMSWDGPILIERFFQERPVAFVVLLMSRVFVTHIGFYKDYIFLIFG